MATVLVEMLVGLGGVVAFKRCTVCMEEDGTDRGSVESSSEGGGSFRLYVSVCMCVCIVLYDRCSVKLCSNKTTQSQNDREGVLPRHTCCFSNAAIVLIWVSIRGFADSEGLDLTRFHTAARVGTIMDALLLA